MVVGDTHAVDSSAVGIHFGVAATDSSPVEGAVAETAVVAAVVDSSDAVA